MPSLQRQQAHPPEVRGARLRNVPSAAEGREAEEGRATHHPMTTERDRIRGVTVVTFTPEEFHHFQAGNRPHRTRRRMRGVVRLR